MGCANQCAALAGVSHEEVEFSLVSHKPSGQSLPSALLPWVNLPMMLQPWSWSFGSLTSVSYSKLMMASRTLKVFKRPDSEMKANRGIGAQPRSEKCLPNQAGMTGWQSVNSRTSAKPVLISGGKRALMLEIFLGFALFLEAGWVGFHIDADVVSRVIFHVVPEATVAVFDTGILNVI